MPVPVEVSHIKRSSVDRSGLEGLGGMWRDRPWYMSERNLVVEIERPEDKRQWEFFVVIDGKNVPLRIVERDGRKYLAAAGKPATLLGLPEWTATNEAGP